MLIIDPELQLLINEAESNYKFSDYEQGVTEPVMKGRLKCAIQFWRRIGANDFVLSIIEQGYKLPLLSTPLPQSHYITINLP